MPEIVSVNDRKVKMREFFEKHKGEIGTALARVGVTPDRIIRAVFTSAQKNPKLYDCTPDSVYKAVLLVAQAGLIPDGITQQAHLIPRNNRKKGVMECNLQLGYRGMLTLVRRSGEVSAVWATCVYEKDQFECYEGTDRRIEHVPYRGDDEPGKLVGVYACAKFRDGSTDFEYLARRDVMRAKSMAQGTDKSDSPWVLWESEMWRKTALLRLCKRLPQSEDASRLLELDAQAHAGKSQTLDETDYDGADIDAARPADADVSDVDPEPTEPNPTFGKDDDADLSKPPF